MSTTARSSMVIWGAWLGFCGLSAWLVRPFTAALLCIAAACFWLGVMEGAAAVAATLALYISVVLVGAQLLATFRHPDLGGGQDPNSLFIVLGAAYGSFAVAAAAIGAIIRLLSRRAP